MTVKADAQAITPTANAKSVSVARGSQLTDAMTLVATRASELQVLVKEVIKLHPMTTRPITIGGTAHTGDLLTLNITASGGSLIALTYTMTAADTLQSAAINLANSVNGNAALQFGGVTATAPVAGVFNLSYGLTPVVSASVTGGGATTTLTVGSASGGADATNLTALNTLLGELL
jgi:hypothetical protein